MPSIIPLCDLPTGEQASVCRLLHTGSMRRRLQDIGLLPGTPVACVGHAPGGDPTAYTINGAVIAIRREDSRYILVCPLGTPTKGVD